MYEKYRILRDNKERGPLTLEELLALHLKPLDLIWEEGRSAGWRYPTEIDSLKNYMEADPAMVGASSQVHPASQNARTPVSTAPAPALTMTVADDHAENQEGQLTAEKLERKAAEIYRRVQAYTEQKEKEEEGVQTKYAKSLEDLKQEYADWLHQKKSGRKLNLVMPGKKSMLIAAGILLVGISLWLLWPFKSSHDLQQASLVSHASISGSSLNEEPDGAREHEKPIQVSNRVSEVITNQEQVTPPSSVDAFIDSVERVMTSAHKTHPGIIRKKQPVSSPGTVPADTQDNSGRPVTSLPAPPVKAETSAIPKVNLNARYDHEPNRKNITSLEVTIQNNSSVLLKSVAVDVFYYKKGDRLFDRETIYFNNIPPGNALTVSRPGNKKAVHARFELGQVIPMNN